MNFKKTFIIISAIAIILLSEHVAAAAQTKSTTVNASSALDIIVEQRMKEAGIVGIGAAIIVNKKVVWTKGYGFADKADALPFTTNTIMNIGSISKTVTGVALMRAVQDGKLSLDEDINAYLPFKVINPSFPKEKITLRHLATHTSSITDRSSIYESTYHFGGDSPEPLGQFLKSYFASNGKQYSKDNFLNVKPGTNREYSNIAAGLAGYIVELAVGEKLNVYTKRHVFVPLKMDNTGWFLSEISLANHSTLYVAHGLVIPIQLYEGTTYPDGGVRTSVADLSKFFIALLNNGEYEGTRILDSDSTAEMLRFQFTDANRPENFPAADGNSGLFWRTRYNGTRIGHGGGDPGIQTEMFAELSKDVGVIMFMNTSLCETEQGSSTAISDALWKYAATLKDEEQKAATN
jgi:CubicO group peptidase (beta-lactamase class C family)